LTDVSNLYLQEKDENAKLRAQMSAMASQIEKFEFEFMVRGGVLKALGNQHDEDKASLNKQIYKLNKKLEGAQIHIAQTAAQSERNSETAIKESDFFQQSQEILLKENEISNLETRNKELSLEIQNLVLQLEQSQAENERLSSQIEMMGNQAQLFVTRASVLERQLTITEKRDLETQDESKQAIHLLRAEVERQQQELGETWSRLGESKRGI
ncbi:hypothetical protein HDU99_010756, partial [Rhizoclosmatium hyalinum]